MITNYDDLELLAWMTLGFDEGAAIELMNAATDPEEEFKYDIDTELEKRYGCSFHQFSELIEALLPMTPIAESMINGDRYHAFIGKDGCAIVKIDA